MGDLKILFDEMLAANVKTGLILVAVFTLLVIIVTAALTAKYFRERKEGTDAE